MDFIPRGRYNASPQRPTNKDADEAGPSRVESPGPSSDRRKHIDWATRTVRIELFIVLLGCSLILVAVSLFLGFNVNTKTSPESDRVDTSKYQAVFLNGGATSGNVLYSTYFGRLRAMNDKYLVLQDVYYLTASNDNNGRQSASQLTKLGCDQLHAPYDQMIINRNQVAFWENIRDDGGVVKAIGEYKKQNPNGPDCKASTKTEPKKAPANTQSTTP
jgi:hypothetical protein